MITLYGGIYSEILQPSCIDQSFAGDLENSGPQAFFQKSSVYASINKMYPIYMY